MPELVGFKMTNACCCALQTFMLITTSMMLHYQNGLLWKAEQKSGDQRHSLEFFTQIVEDWETKPITDLAITHENSCSWPFEDAIIKVWPGSVQYCDCTRSKDSDVLSYYPNKSCPRKCYN